MENPKLGRAALDGDPAVAVAQIKDHHRQHVSSSYPAPGICVKRCAGGWPCEPYRAAAALEAVLEAAAGWKQLADDGDARDKCASEVREAVARGLGAVDG